MNRQGIEYSESPLLQMSFETVTHFLQNSCLYGYKDSMISPAARLCTGQVRFSNLALDASRLSSPALEPSRSFSHSPSNGAGPGIDLFASSKRMFLFY